MIANTMKWFYSLNILQLKASLTLAIIRNIFPKFFVFCFEWLPMQWRLLFDKYLSMTGFLCIGNQSKRFHIFCFLFRMNCQYNEDFLFVEYFSMTGFVCIGNKTKDFNNFFFFLFGMIANIYKAFNLSDIFHSSHFPPYIYINEGLNTDERKRKKTTASKRSTGNRIKTSGTLRC